MAVVPSCIGGLGNQIFIAVAGYLVGQQTGADVLLPNATNNVHNQTNDYRDTILSKVGEKYNGTASEYRKEHPRTWIYTHADFEPWHPSMIHPPVILEGYYQFVDPILEKETEIRSLLLQGLAPIRKTIANSHPFDFSTTGFLHVRRGDYLKHSTIHYNLPLQYYVDAYRTLPNKPKTLLLFSDDPDWVETQPSLMKLPGAKSIRNLNELETLALMSLCQGPAICANSTFSWWGAFLGPYSNRSAVMIPSKWINQKIYSLFPREWTVIPC